MTMTMKMSCVPWVRRGNSARMWRVWRLVIVLPALFPGTLSGADLLVRLSRKTPGPPVLSARLDVEGLQSFLGAKRLNLYDADSGAAVVSVFDARDGAVYWRASEPWMGVHRFRIRAGEQSALPPEGQGKAAVHAVESADAVVVETPWVRVRHPKKKNGGLPERIYFKSIRREDPGLVLNDRLYDRAVRTVFCLKYDREPEVGVTRLGGLGLVVRVRARYVSSAGEWPASHPRAVYRFFYRADSPTVEVTADVRQDRTRLWNELHFLELHHKQSFFPKWTGGGQQAVHTFTPPEKDRGARKDRAAQTSSWGVMFGGGAAIAMLVPGRVRFYDGAAGYGTYMHGPWISNWNGTRWEGKAYLYLGPDAGAPKAVAEWAAANRPLLDAQVSLDVPELSAEIRRARTAARSPLQRWALARTLKELRAGRRIGGVRDAIGRIPDPAAVRRMLFAGESTIVVEGERLLAALGPVGKSPDSGWGCVGLFDLHRNVEVCGMDAEGLWRIRFAKPDGSDPVQIGADSSGVGPPEVERHGKREVTLRWKACPLPDGGGRFAVRADVRASSRGLLWRIRVVNESRTRGMYSIEFPVLAGLDARRASVERDWIVYPDGWGVKMPCSRDVFYHRRYPSGSCTMQFMLYGTDAGGLFAAAEDGRAYTKELWADAARGGGARLTFLHYPENILQPGVGYEQPFDIVTRAYSGDWYEGARIYRRWALKQKWASAGPVVSRKDVAQRFKELALWIRTPPKPADAVAAARKARDFFRLPMADHWYNWHQIRFDDDYPNYFPPKEGFKEAVARMNRMRVWVMPYINGRLWDTDTENFRLVGCRYCTRDPKGEPYIEVYGSGEKLAAMCPFTRVWQDTVYGIVTRLIGEYGTAGVYLDQIGAARPRLCMDRSHGHPLGGGDWWVRGYEIMLGRIRKRVKQIDPEAFLTTESNAEPYMRFFDGYLMCNSTRPDLIPLYSAVYHDYVLLFGRYAFPWDLQRDPDAFYTKIGQLFVFGAQMGWISTSILDSRWRAGAEYLKTLSAIREKALPWLAFGELLPALHFDSEPPQVHTVWRRFRTDQEVVMSAVQRSVWRSPDGRVGVALTNVSREPITVSWHLDAEKYGLPSHAPIRVLRVTAAGEENMATVRGPRLRFSQHLAPHTGCFLILE